MNIVKQLLLIITLFGLPTTSFSENPKSDSDFRSLPPFCKARVSGGKSALYKSWHKRLGEDFIHVHHYCSGLHTLNIARRTFDKKHQKRLLNTAISEVNYMERHAKKNFTLFPYIFTTKGEIYSALGNTTQAVKYYNMAIIKNRKLTRAYLNLANIFHKLGQKDMALKTINDGLKYKPKSKSLNRKLKKYGAK